MNRLKTLFLSWIFPWIPKRLLSRATGVVMRIPLPWPFKGPLIRGFAWFFKINSAEGERAPCTYRSFDDYFTRQLKSGLRPVQGQVVHPVDGQLTERGVASFELLQAKGWTYSLAEFLGDEKLAAEYMGGTFYTYYLCPSDYHRVHSPTAGEMVSARHIPGLLWPVNDWSVTNIRRLFNLNERVVLNFTSVQGRWSLVLVGATNVGHITITSDPSITTNRWLWHAPTSRDYTPPIPVQTGDELGMFHLGSTVICIYEKSFALKPGQGAKAVRWGEPVSEDV